MKISNSVDWDVESSVRTKVDRSNTVVSDNDVGDKVGSDDGEVIE